LPPSPQPSLPVNGGRGRKVAANHVPTNRAGSQEHRQSPLWRKPVNFYRTLLGFRGIINAFLFRLSPFQSSCYCKTHFFCPPERSEGFQVIKNTRFFGLYENSYQQSAFSFQQRPWIGVGDQNVGWAPPTIISFKKTQTACSKFSSFVVTFRS